MRGEARDQDGAAGVAEVRDLGREEEAKVLHQRAACVSISRNAASLSVANCFRAATAATLMTSSVGQAYARLTPTRCETSAAARCNSLANW